MPCRSLPVLLLALGLLLWPSAVAQPVAEVGDGLEDTPVAKSPAEAKAAAEKLLAEYRKPKLDGERRKAIVGEILTLGPEGTGLLVAELAKDAAARRKAYLARFDKAAAKAGEQRLNKPAAKRDLQELRGKVLAVSHAREVVAEKITDFADPARKQLEALLTLPREDVLKSDAALTADRELVLAIAEWWREAAAKAPAGASGKPAAAPPAAGALEQELADAESFAATLAALPDRKDRAVLQSNLEPAKKLDPAEAQGIFILNILRARLGLGALAIDLKLCEASRGHSKDMAEFNFFDHVSPVPGKEDPFDRAKAAGTTANAENIYQGGARGEDAIEGWWHSPGHHANMMTKGYKRVGLGRYEGYWTQMFGG